MSIYRTISTERDINTRGQLVAAMMFFAPIKVNFLRLLFVIICYVTDCDAVLNARKISSLNRLDITIKIKISN